VYKIESPVIVTNTATFTIGAPYTTNVMKNSYGYKLWNGTDKALLASGQFEVVFAPIES
jgi:hypothetical protein